MRKKAKFNKSKCLKCKYHYKMSNCFQGRTERGAYYSVVCNYASITDHTCLTREGNRVIDRRGEDYNDCKLFQEGKPLKVKIPDVPLGGVR